MDNEASEWLRTAEMDLGVAVHLMETCCRLQTIIPSMYSGRMISLVVIMKE